MDNQWQEIIRGERRAEDDLIERWAELARAGDRRAIEEAAAERLEGASDLVRRAVRLLIDADQSWTTASGTVREAAGKDVLDLGHHVHIRERGRVDEVDNAGETPDVNTDERECWETEGRFVAAQPPLRLRLERLRQVGLFEGPGADLVIQAPRHYWVVTDGRAERIHAAPERQFYLPRTGEKWAVYEDGVERGPGGSVSYGTENLPALLRPTRLVRAFEFTSAARTIEAERDAIQMSAVPVSSDDFYLFAPELAVPGSAEYTITIDATYGIVLAWRALINGLYARGQTVSNVKIDEPVEEAAFAAPNQDS